MENSAETQITNNETIENNKLIAEFMGNSFEPLPDTNNECFSLLGSWDVIHITDFETGIYAYHSDWNKLMEVVKKCRVESNEEDSHWEVIYYSLADLDIDNVYTAVISFIKWYNENK